MIRIVTIFITIGFVLGGFTFCVKIQEQIGTNKKFVVVVEDTIGEQYFLAKEFCDSLELPVIYVENPNLSMCIEGINNGEYALIAKKMIITSDLRDQLAFTTSLSVDKQVLVQRECGDSTCEYIDDLLKMEGKKIYVTSASPTILRLKNIQHEIGANFEIVETPHTQSEYLFEQLSNGVIDYVACDYETASKILGNYTNLDINTKISFSQFKAWAVHKDSTQLLTQLDEFLQKKIINR